MNYQPVFIIGAGRSGTNILRDSITSFDCYESWPCDEINLVWRHGNVGWPTDEFGPDHATPAVIKYLRNFFEKFARKSGATFVIEKTCANSLRVPFVDRIFPEARYIYIVRDGRDVAASAVKRWTASIEPDYLLKKLRYVPIADIPVYAAQFIRNRLFQWRQPDRRQASWGPRFDGMDAAVRNNTLQGVCALQWAACIESSERAFSEMSPTKVFRLKYEDFAAQPAEQLEKIFAWLGAPLSDTTSLTEMAQKISSGPVGSWHNSNLASDTLAVIEPLLLRLGYDSNSRI